MSTNYREKAAALLQREVSFELLARGKKERLVGVLCAHIPAGQTLAESEVKVADRSLLDGFGARDHSGCAQEKCRGCQRRARAEVVVVRSSDPATGTVQFFTPRVQQVVWS